MRIETLSGIKTLQLNKGADGKVVSAKVDMGAPVLEGGKIPSTFAGDKVVGAPLAVEGRQFAVTLVSMGKSPLRGVRRSRQGGP